MSAKGIKRVEIVVYGIMQLAQEEPYAAYIAVNKGEIFIPDVIADIKKTARFHALLFFVKLVNCSDSPWGAFPSAL